MREGRQKTGIEKWLEDDNTIAIGEKHCAYVFCADSDGACATPMKSNK